MVSVRQVGVAAAMLVAGLGWMACGSAPAPKFPGGVAAGPVVGVVTDERSWRARQLHEAGRVREALEVCDEVLRDDPDHVDAHRVRQDILRRRGRLGRLLWESEQRLAEDPSSDDYYLAGRIARTSREKLALFRETIDRMPESFWGWLGTAFVMRERDPEQALEIYRWLYRETEGHPLVAIALASSLRSVRGMSRRDRRANLNRATKLYQRLRGHPLSAGIGELGLAETYFQLDEQRRAWPPLLSALRLRPFDPGVHRLLHDLLGRGLPADQIDQLVDALQADSTRFDEMIANEGSPVLARLFAADGQPHAALSVLREVPQAASGGPRDPGLHREWRRLLLSVGDVKTCLASLRARFPMGLLDDESNRVRGVWVRLFGGPWMASDDPTASLGETIQLVDALTRAGLLEEADTLASMARVRHATDPGLSELTVLQEEVRRELVFERSVRRILYRGYSRGSDFGLDRALDEMRRVSLQTLGVDVVGESERFHVPFVGDLLDSTGEGIVAHFASYNRHLVLGQRDGAAAEGLMFVRLSVREFDRVADLPLAAPTLEVIGEDRRIRSLSGVYGGDLAGVALINHAIIDMDSVREWADEIRERRTIVREDGGALLHDPVPARSGALEPASAPWILSVLSPQGDAELDDAILDIIRWHERAHLVDGFHFLPAESNLWRVLGLLLGHGFDSFAIEAEMEARAECASLAISPYTRLVLAHIAVFLEADQAASVHALGFRGLAERLNAKLAAEGLPARVCEWHKLDPAVVRRLGRELLHEQW